MNEVVIGVDIGGTKIAAHIANQQHTTLHEATVSTPATEGGTAIMQTVIDLCQSLLDRANNVQLVGMGVGAAGQINPNTGVVIDANENLNDWIGTPIANTLHNEFNVPVRVDNDVRTMALAEATLGAGRGYRHLLCLTVGTGIGGAIVLNGKLWHGAHYSAGEFGYMRVGNHVTIEEAASGVAIEEDYDFDRRYSLREITQRGIDGDQKARRVIRDSAEILAETLAPIMVFLDPQAVIIGGGVVHIAYWWKWFMNTMNLSSFGSAEQMPILRAELGNRAGMVGAGLIAWQGANDT